MGKPVLFVEGNAGAGGDMLLAALLDLGFPSANLKKIGAMLPVAVDFREEKNDSHGFSARRVIPILPKSPKKKWTARDFFAAIEACRLPRDLKSAAAGVFNRLAEAEGAAHGKKIETLHFHELGGWDTLFDIVGVLAGFRHFDPAEIYAGPLNVGGGFAGSEHGPLPVPPPAVTALLKGFAVYSSGERTELVTPTGAALLSSLAKPAAALPPMTLSGCGCGAGTKRLAIPNVLRILMGAPLAFPSGDSILKLETNVDDMNPQIWEHVLGKLYDAGAHEAYLTPVMMKKSRPATVLTVLAPLEKENELAAILFRETTTLGIRREVVARRTLKRKSVKVRTSLGEIACKAAYENGTMLNLSPEYDAMKRLADKRGTPLKKLYHQVMKELSWPGN